MNETEWPRPLDCTRTFHVDVHLGYIIFPAAAQHLIRVEIVTVRQANVSTRPVHPINQFLTTRVAVGLGRVAATTRPLHTPVPPLTHLIRRVHAPMDVGRPLSQLRVVLLLERILLFVLKQRRAKKRKSPLQIVGLAYPPALRGHAPPLCRHAFHWVYEGGPFSLPKFVFLGSRSP